MTLPARLFRWRGYDNGPEVMTFRIAQSYNTRRIRREHIEAALTELPEGLDHTMCFVGLGDHGGGPTETQIAWCRENQDAFPGAQLVFSSPKRFFDAAAEQNLSLPLVTGELQFHAPGCYSVYRPVKTALRRAEHLLHQAEVMLDVDPAPDPAAETMLDEAWQRVCLHQFHDTLGGTCLPSAYRQVEDQIAAASAFADESLQYGLRRLLLELPDDPMQRIVAFNASDTPFNDYSEFEPWLDSQAWQPHWRLLDAQGAAVPFQILQDEALITVSNSRLLFKSQLAPGALGVFRIDTDGSGLKASISAPITARLEELRSGVGANWTAISLDFADTPAFSLPRLELIPDLSDTWSHGRVWGDVVDRYHEGPITSPLWNAGCLADRGPLRGAVLQTGTIGQSILRQEWRVYADEAFVELRLSVHWHETQKLLKLTLPLPLPAQHRTDGILGGWLARELNGRELPLRDGMLLDLGDSLNFGIVCPDIFAADVTPERVRLTLLRSPYMAHHEPIPAGGLRAVVSDQGVHEFRFRFFCDRAVDTDLLDHQAFALQRPLVLADLTRGMPARDPQ